MPTYKVEDRTYEVDDDGFLQEPELWNENVARDLALTEGITELNPEHWQLINYIRNYFYSMDTSIFIMVPTDSCALTPSTIYLAEHLQYIFPQQFPV